MLQHGPSSCIPNRPMDAAYLRNHCSDDLARKYGRGAQGREDRDKGIAKLCRAENSRIDFKVSIKTNLDLSGLEGACLPNGALSDGDGGFN